MTEGILPEISQGEWESLSVWLVPREGLTLPSSYGRWNLTSGRTILFSAGRVLVKPWFCCIGLIICGASIMCCLSGIIFCLYKHTQRIYPFCPLGFGSSGRLHFDAARVERSLLPFPYRFQTSRNEKTRLPDFGVIFKAIYDYVYMSKETYL